jgi:hypothetical protein
MKLNKIYVFFLLLNSFSSFGQIKLWGKLENGTISKLNYKFSNRIEKKVILNYINISDLMLDGTLIKYFNKNKQKSHILLITSSMVIFNISKEKLVSMAYNRDSSYLNDNFLINLLQNKIGDDDFLINEIGNGKFAIASEYNNYERILTLELYQIKKNKYLIIDQASYNLNCPDIELLEPKPIIKE